MKRTTASLALLLALFVWIAPVSDLGVSGVESAVVYADSHDVDPPEDAGGLVPCTNNCGFAEFIILIDKVLTFLMGFAVVVATIGFVYAGFLYVTNNGDTSRIAKAHSVFKNIFVGLIIVVSAWLIINSIVGFFLDDTYKEALDGVRDFPSQNQTQ